MREDIKAYLDNTFGIGGLDKEQARVFAHEELVVGWGLTEKQAERVLDAWAQKEELR